MQLFTSILDETLEAWQGVRQGVIDEVENIPANKFGFRPTEENRTITELVQHILEVAHMFTGELTRPDTNFHREPWPDLLARYASHIYEVKSKAGLVELLKTSFDEAEKKFRKVGEVFMLQLITRFDGVQGTRLAWLNHGIAHEYYHCGQLALYARLIGKVPALTQQIYGS